MILGYPRKLVSKELQKLNIFVPPRQVTEKDVLLIHKIREERLRDNFAKTGACKMKYPKGTIFVSYDEPYTVVGTLYIVNDSYVLVPQDEDDTEVLLYTENEIEEGLDEGGLVIKQ